MSLSKQHWMEQCEEVVTSLKSVGIDCSYDYSVDRNGLMKTKVNGKTGPLLAVLKRGSPEVVDRYCVYNFGEVFYKSLINSPQDIWIICCTEMGTEIHNLHGYVNFPKNSHLFRKAHNVNCNGWYIPEICLESIPNMILGLGGIVPNIVWPKRLPRPDIYYDKYLTSNAWKKFINEVKCHWGNVWKCAACNKKHKTIVEGNLITIDPHHASYDWLYHEFDASGNVNKLAVYDIVPLCKKCHKLLHTKLPNYPGQ